METLSISLNEIQFNPELARQKKTRTKESGGFEAIKESVRNIGLKEPLIVYEDNGSYFLCDGHNRIRAIKELIGEDSLPENLDVNNISCIVIPQESKNIIRYMTDIRQDLQPSLKARYIKTLFEKDVTRKDIARICGYSINTIRNWLNVARLLEPLQNLMDVGKLPVDCAVTVSPLNEQGQQRLYNKIKNWSAIRRDEVRKLVSAFPHKYFNLSKSEREEISDKLKIKSTVDKKSHSEKQFLSKSLHKLSLEQKILDNELVSVRRNIRSLVAWIQRILRVEEIREYLMKHHENILKELNDILEIEVGRSART